MDNANKDLIQSYILTTAKYDYTAYEKRILYRVVELMQELTEEKKLNQKYSVQTNLFGDVDIQMPVSSFLKDENDQNYGIAKKALKSLNSKQIEYEDNKVWKLFNLIERPVIDKKGYVTFRLHPIIASVFLDFSKGFRKYELKTAMQFESVYAMRFYELMSGQEKPLTYLIDDLKNKFKLENKYQRINDFFRKVIDVAKRELDKKSPYSFEYKINKQGKKFHSITFYPVHQPQHMDENIERQKLNNQLSLGWDLSRETIQYLREVFLFDTKEINQHRELLKQAEKDLDILVVLAKAKRYAETAKNPKGYIISCIKKAIKDLDKKENVEIKNTPEISNVKEKPSMDLLDQLAKNLRVNK
uniref:RepA n=1 Tax=Capnocytophaga canimorsus TaxID=28188 RepID=B6D407_9FLAO|nr:replication initiation protein [Capnocytophaga canimorsus]ACI15353.1 RepA [Capnocytophaga canimorsus]